MDERERQGSSGPLWLIGALFLVAALALVAWNIELPYLAFSSGPVSDAVDAVNAEEVEVFPPRGELLMLTIVSQDVNLFEAAIAGLDPTIDLVPREAFRPPDESDEEFRRRVLAQMDDSQQRAITVAMNQLGYQMVPRDVLVVDVAEGVPSADVLEIGDTIESVDGAEVSSGDQLTGALEGRHPGDIVDMGIVREGTDQEVEVELVARPDDPSIPMIGISVQDLTDPPFPITLDAGNVGGPSAGMMHTLAIMDTLTPGDMTGGHVVAGTGTIQYDGTVGAIGGVRQKVVAAEAAGAEYVLVPENNYEQALTAPRRTIEIVPVASIDDALDFLADLGTI